MRKFLGFLSLVAVLCASLGVASVPSRASGGSGSGGSTTILVVRVTGYVTAIDYEHSTITVGASYYGTGVLNVTPNTKISLDNVNCDLSAIKVGQWAEARYDFYTRNAIRLTCITM